MKLLRTKRRYRKQRKIRTYIFSIIFFGIFAVMIFGYMYHLFFLEHSSMQPKKGGIYTEAVLGTAYNLNPYAKNNTPFDRSLHKLLFSGLLEYNPQTNQIENSLANLQISPDGKVYELTLNENIYFSDGTKVTIGDVLFTYESVIKNDDFYNTSLRHSFDDIKIETPDDNTITFTLPEENAFFLYLLTSPILPSQYFQDAFFKSLDDPYFSFNLKPIGTGPYVVSNLILNTSDNTARIFLKRNSYYKKAPYIDEIIFYVFRDFDDIYKSKFNFDGFSGIPYHKLSSLEDLFSYRYQRFEFLLPRFVGVFLNLDRSIVDELSFRRALRLSFPIDSITENGWDRIDSPFFYYDIETKYIQNDFPRARQILRQSKYVYDENLGLRVRGKGGDPVDIKLITTASPPIYSRYAQSIQKAWEKELNIKVSLSVLSETEFSQAVRTRDYDAIVFGHDFSQRLDSFSIWHSDLSGKTNFSNITNANLDGLIESTYRFGRDSDILSLDRRVEELVPAIVFATPRLSVLMSHEIKGAKSISGKIRNLGDRFLDISSWHLYEERRLNLKSDHSRWRVFFQWIINGGKEGN